MGIDIKHLFKLYNKQAVLKNISLDIKSGELVGLLGPNGAGKSTLMKCITGAINFEKGDIIINNTSVLKNSLRTKCQIGFLQENNPLYQNMYVREYLNFVTNIRKVDASKVDQAIEKVGLTKEKHKKIYQLSKGYKQRVGLAQAIIFDPEILILDEPTNGLDPNQIIEIRGLIKDIGRHKTVIISTHIMQEVEALCSRVVLLNKGEKITDQPIEEFKGQYENLSEAFYHFTN